MSKEDNLIVFSLDKCTEKETKFEIVTLKIEKDGSLYKEKVLLGKLNINDKQDPMMTVQAMIVVYLTKYQNNNINLTGVRLMKIPMKFHPKLPQNRSM